MSYRRRLLASGLFVLAAAGCDPYDNFTGEYNAGPVDPVNFPPDYVAGGNRMQSGSGTFNALQAYVSGTAVGYYRFSDANGFAATVDHLRVVGPSGTIPTPTAYNFSGSCAPPANYGYDPVRDEVHYDEQGNVFSGAVSPPALPRANYNPGAAVTFSYVPVMREIQVTSNGGACQSIKTEKTLRSRFPGTQPSSNYLAWAIIDPGDAVFRLGQRSVLQGGTATGSDVQRWGWYEHYLVAYLDGGVIPTRSEPLSVTDMTMVTRMVPQKLYFPRSNVIAALGVACSGGTGTPPRCAPGQVCVTNNCTACTATGAAACPTGQTCAAGLCSAVGAAHNGYDVLQGKRDDSSYSPLCQLQTYSIPGAAVVASSLPKDETTILTNYGPIQNPGPGTGGAPQYVYCLQTQ